LTFINKTGQQWLAITNNIHTQWRTFSSAQKWQPWNRASHSATHSDTTQKGGYLSQTV